MKQKYSSNSYILLALFLAFNSFCLAQSPTLPSENFNVFIENNATLITNETDGPMAIGKNLNLQGNYQVATNYTGDFEVGGNRIGLLVGGKVNYNSGNALQVNQNTYIKIGDSQNSHVWYYDQNNAASPIRITPNSNYNSSPRIMLQANSNQLNVGVNNNPVFESDLIDFASAFQEMRTLSASISQCTGNAQLTNPNGQPIPSTNLPNQVKINLQNGINYLNVTGSDMNNVQVFTYNQQPSANKILVINVDAPGTFNWNVWNQAGIGFQNCPFILYNFYNTTTLNIQGNSTIEGTVYAPFANIVKTVNQSNIEGQVIAKSLVHGGGEMHYAVFQPSLSGCAPVAGVPPTADFNINSAQLCFADHEFIFDNTSHTGSTNQPEAPFSYHWDFGDGTSSTSMCPVKTYSAPGIYTVTLTTTNAYGSDTESIQVEVFPTIDAIVSETTIASGSGVVTKEFTLTNSDQFSNFYWEVSNGASNLFPNQSTVAFDFTTAGYYEVTVHTTDNNTCENSTIIPITIESDEVNTGNDGGLESESLGDAVSKQYIQRKKRSISTKFKLENAEVFNKSELSSSMTARSQNGLTLLEMFPEELTPGNVANISSPTDILDYTIANEVLSVDFSVEGKTKAVVLGIKTIDDVYNHTKASCDRLKGAEILKIQSLEINGYHFLMQAIKQRNDVTEYAISFAIGKNENEENYSLQSNWYVNGYFNSQEVYNFQVWSTKPESTIQLVNDILNNINNYRPIIQDETKKLPSTYAAKITRENTLLNLKLKSLQQGESIEIFMDEVYSETNGFALRYNPFRSEKTQQVTIDIKDGYEYDGRIFVNGEIQDVFYHADGNWGLDYDATYTTIEQYTISNNFDRVYEEDRLAVHRNVELKAHSEYDYLTLYKSLLPGNLPADYSNYNYISFTATGSGLLEIGLLKSSIENWEEQYKANIQVGEDEKTYYLPYNFFSSTGTNKTLSAEDLTMLTFTFLPVEAGTNDLDLTIKNVEFTKNAPNGYEDLLLNLKNQFIAYPNPTQGDVNCLLYSEKETSATISLYNINGKRVYTVSKKLVEGRNDLLISPNLNAGIYFLKVNSEHTDYGVSKIIFN
ncbi:collagen-binding domain-containing protein [Mesonia sp.]|uniref:collagen-binding domain-containing protein n=1 Tax=Mesonia sp. TaxID=1960830 RepID=UPI0017580B5B|nr:collagen-binding domain-containing protein [Mesonia sp.]HIB38444.1 choice-of-anchor A family protein [Mesonia sp.]HIO26802.1 choice-of-anchor A family protein [Flavobacteriaceae bacterium]